MSKIFVRERRKVQQGEKKPRYRIVGVTASDLKLYSKHVRKVELEKIAEVVGAEIVYLPTDGSGSKGQNANR